MDRASEEFSEENKNILNKNVKKQGAKPCFFCYIDCYWQGKDIILTKRLKQSIIYLT